MFNVLIASPIHPLKNEKLTEYHLFRFVQHNGAEILKLAQSGRTVFSDGTR